MDTKKEKTEKKESAIKENKDFYLTNDAKNWDYSDYVKVSTSPRGMILSFGKFVLADKKFGIFKEILIPYEVAESLSGIIKAQFDKLIEDGAIKKITETDGEQND
jgi:hypothetical protein